MQRVIIQNWLFVLAIFLNVYSLISSIVITIYRIHTFCWANSSETSNWEHHITNNVIEMSDMKKYCCKDQHVRNFWKGDSMFWKTTLRFFVYVPIKNKREQNLENHWKVFVMLEFSVLFLRWLLNGSIS